MELPQDSLHSKAASLKALEGKTWNDPVVVGDRLYVRNAQEAALSVDLRGDESACCAILRTVQDSTRSRDAMELSKTRWRLPLLSLRRNPSGLLLNGLPGGRRLLLLLIRSVGLVLLLRIFLLVCFW